MNIRLLSLNVALFEANNSKLTKFLQEQKADIVCLQEVVRETEESVLPQYVTKGSVDEATQNLKYSFYGPNAVMHTIDLGEFHGQKNFHFDLGGPAEMGNYVRSKFKIKKKKNVFLEN
ncbi:MAG: hypothetical protein HYV55_00005, partial [Parcubacteria group bacterium]|nr:hypothetical protein [Parcubacteria group bacterium]